MHLPTMLFLICFPAPMDLRSSGVRRKATRQLPSQKNVVNFCLSEWCVPALKKKRSSVVLQLHPNKLPINGIRVGFLSVKTSHKVHNTEHLTATTPQNNTPSRRRARNRCSRSFDLRISEVQACSCDL